MKTHLGSNGVVKLNFNYMIGIRLRGKNLDELIIGLDSDSGVIACIIDITYGKGVEPQVKFNATGLNSKMGERLTWIKDANLAIGDKISFEIINTDKFTQSKINVEVSKEELARKKLAAFQKLKEELTADGLL